MKYCIIIILLLSISISWSQSRKSYLEQQEKRLRNEIAIVKKTINRLQIVIKNNSINCNYKQQGCQATLSMNRANLQAAIVNRQTKYEKLSNINTQLQEILHQEINLEKRKKIIAQDTADPLEQDIDYEADLDLDFSISSESVEKHRVSDIKNFTYTTQEDNVFKNKAAKTSDSNRNFAGEWVDANKVSNNKGRAPASIPKGTQFNKRMLSLDEVKESMIKAGLSKRLHRHATIYRHAITSHHAKFNDSQIKGELSYIETKTKYMFFTKELEIQSIHLPKILPILINLIGDTFNAYDGIEDAKIALLASLKNVSATSYQKEYKKIFKEISFKIKTKASKDPKTFLFDIKISAQKPVM